MVSNKFPFGKQDFKYFLRCKDNKEIRPLYILQKWVYIKKYFNKIKCMYFMIKDKKIDKCMTISEKHINIIKKISWSTYI